MRLRLPCVSRTIFQNHTSKALPLSRFLSTDEATERRHHLFSLEKKRQLDEVGRIDKIEIKYKGIPNDCTLVMNKNISTPYDCAKHLSEWHAESTALALLDGQVHWDMHRPLTDSCTLESYQSAEPAAVNKAFWRTCSLLLGAAVSRAFKDGVAVRLHSFPSPDIRSGSFIYDVDLPSLPEWKPTSQELHALSAELVKLAREGLPLERLDAGAALAEEMFADNPHKAGQVPSVARANPAGKVTLYRVGKHVDISKGPLISNTAQVGRATVAAVHRLAGAPAPGGHFKQLYRFQGVALPVGVILNHFAYGILIERAAKLNPARSPVTPFEDSADRHPVAAKA